MNNCILGNLQEQHISFWDLTSQVTSRMWYIVRIKIQKLKILMKLAIKILEVDTGWSNTRNQPYRSLNSPFIRKAQRAEASSADYLRRAQCRHVWKQEHRQQEEELDVICDRFNGNAPRRRCPAERKRCDWELRKRKRQSDLLLRRKRFSIDAFPRWRPRRSSGGCSSENSLFEGIDIFLLPKRPEGRHRTASSVY